MSSIGDQKNLKTHWRSLADLHDLPEYRAFAEAEFPETADPGGVNRRRWLQVMGASFALAGVAGCEAKREEVLPFAKRPEGRTPGQPQRFATAMELSGSAIGLLVTSVDGRPIKVEGNPLHPQSLGGSHALAQAAVLELYDPDRSQNPVQLAAQGPIVHAQKDKWSGFDEFVRQHFAGVKERRGAGLAVLSPASSSPTLTRLRGRLQHELPEARWLVYEPLHDDSVRAGAKLALGAPYRTQLDLSSARVVLTLDADLLGSHPASLRYARDFARGREVVDGQMNRLYAVESCFTMTGSAADHRLPIRSGQVPAFVGRLLQRVQQLLSSSVSTPSGESHVEKFLAALAVDLVAHRGAGIVAAGDQQSAEVHAAVHQLNALLENVGKTVNYTLDPSADDVSQVESLKALVSDMQGGNVDTLLILGGNPAYDAPADLEFAAALQKVKTTIHAGLYRNETARLCQWHVPQAHFLESWSDARSFDGTYSIVQPLLAPLYGGRTGSELVARVLGDAVPKSEELVRATFKALVGEKYNESLWRRTVHDGLLTESAYPAETVTAAREASLPTEWSEELPKNGALELVFCRDASVYDGRFANNGWLQECPDPLTKLTWDNAALVGSATAKMLGVSSQTLATLKLGGMLLKVPVYVMPGQAEGSIALALGYGRTAAGLVGGLSDAEVPAVGVNSYLLRGSQAMYVATGLTVEATGESHRLAVTQDHFAIDKVGVHERARRVPILVREAPLDEYLKHPDFAQHVEHVPALESMWSEHVYEGHRWGMSIDLTKCIGCNACVVACQAENNIPVVGKDQVLRGREMHWIRVDRYFKGDAERPENVEVAMQPLACHHCELAPCEQVCPVAATVHSSEGLNDMVYNRCIGTRYCGNNCPYKVRRFNYLNFHEELKDANREISKMVFNPDVTVRVRGVMEKCTYCVQRIQAVKIDARNHGRPIDDGQVVTACQQACPAQAIVFGDLADSQSQVARSQQDSRSYALLAELNIKPRTTYLAKVRNPHPDLAEVPDPAEVEEGRAQH